MRLYVQMSVQSRGLEYFVFLGETHDTQDPISTSYDARRRTDPLTWNSGATTFGDSLTPLVETAGLLDVANKIAASVAESA